MCEGGIPENRQLQVLILTGEMNELGEILWEYVIGRFTCISPKQI